MELFYYIASFCLFVILQSFFVNSIFICCKGSKLVDGVSHKIDYEGMIFYMIAPEFFERYKYKWWSKNLWVCVKCMALPYGTITFWPLVIFLFGVKLIEIPIWTFDVFVLVSLNGLVYKKL